MTVEPTLKPFTVEQYHRMAEAGIVEDDERTKLVRGEIVEMTPIGSRHAGHVSYISDLLSRSISDGLLIRIQGPVRLGEYSQLQPDIAVVEQSEKFCADRHPRPEEMKFVIEVADSSIDYDRETKIPLSGEAGVPVALLVDLDNRRIEIWSDRTSDGYANCRRVTGNDLLELETLSESLEAGECFID